MAAGAEHAAAVVTMSVWPLWMSLVPMLAAAPVYLLAGKRPRLAGALAVAAGAAAVLIGLLQLPGATHGALELVLGRVGLGLSWRVDAFSLGIALFAALGWTLALLFSLDYSAHGHGQPRYWAAMLFTMGATLGVFLSGDLITLFLFFELMTFASYLLVVHEETPDAMAAGRTFIYMGCIGGLALCFASMVTGYVAGVGLGVPVLEKLLASGYYPLVAGLVLLGFGMKAGMVPLHIWLPQAHPVAPAPASAVLSGVLIKAGAYGLVRMFLLQLAPQGHQMPLPVSVVGNGLLVIGLTTLVLGGFMAMFQSNAKRILAYSSISQMGYILTGVGAAAVLGVDGAMGFAGASYHMMNHVVFKAAAFMAIGYVYMVTHELDINRLGGMWRQTPMAAIAFLAAFGAILGLPGFSAHASKVMIHHALVEAHHFTHLPAYLVAEKAFVIGSSFTAVYFLRLAGIFFGRERSHCSRSRYVYADAALALLTVVIVAVGLFPGVLLSGIVMPAVEMFPFDHHAVEHVAHLHFFVWPDIRDVLVSFGLGALIYVVGSRFRWWNRPVLAGLSVEGIVYRRLVQAAWPLFDVTTEVDRRYNAGWERVAAGAQLGAGRFDEEPGPVGTPAARLWSPWNLNLGTLALAVTLTAVTVLFVVVGMMKG